MTSRTSSERIEYAWSSCPKWATATSSDVVDVVERPDGLGALLMIDVQGSGSSGSRLAHSLMTFARELLAAGVAPLLVATATSQRLFTLRDGQVSASLHIAIAHPLTDSLSLTGYGYCSVAHGIRGVWESTNFVGESAGTSMEGSPGVLVIPLYLEGAVIIANDGIGRDQTSLDALLPAGRVISTAIALATRIVELATVREDGRPKSDMAAAAIVRIVGAESDRFTVGAKTLPVRNHRGAL